MSKTFSYSYMQLQVTAELGDALSVKMGFRTKTIPIESIRYVYVVFQNQYHELIVAYDKPNGSRGIFRSYANPGHPQFKAFVDDLAALKPGIDIRQLPKKEALKTMGARDAQLIAMITIPVVVTALLLIGFMPLIIHGADDGLQQIAVEELGKTKLTTHNLVVRGELDVVKYLEITHTKNGIKEYSEYIFPVYPPGAPEGAFVPLLLQTRELGDSAVDELAERGEWRCVLQNVMWEGPSSEDLDYLRDKLHHNVTKDTLLCELSDHHAPLWGVLSGMLCTALVFSVVIIVVVRRRRAR